MKMKSNDELIREYSDLAAYLSRYLKRLDENIKEDPDPLFTIDVRLDREMLLMLIAMIFFIVDEILTDIVTDTEEDNNNE